MMQYIISALFLALGIISIISPKNAWEIRTFLGRKLFSVKYKANKKTYSRIKFLGIFYLLIGVLIFINAQKGKANESVYTPPPTPYETTISGEYVCLPHKDTSRPVTLECAFGLLDDNGDHYALDFGKNSNFSSFEAGQMATLSGTFTPVEYLSVEQKYNIVGVLSVRQ